MGAGDPPRGIDSGGGRMGALNELPGVSAGLTAEGGGKGAAECDGDGMGKVYGCSC